MAKKSEIILKTENIDFFYGKTQVLKDINVEFYKNKVTAIVGPSGCGKSTFIRLFNRMNDLVPNSKVKGKIHLDGENILSKKTDVVKLRRKVGMVFQKPNPFPKSIYQNVSYGLEIKRKNKEFIKEKVVKSLKRAALWEEVKDRLYDSALELSGGQQQRLCIARCLAVEPEVLLFDEPCASLDPHSTRRIEELIQELKEYYTIIAVTHNLQQASRIADYTAFLYLGELVEYGETGQLFTVPKDKRTEQYLTGKFG